MVVFVRFHVGVDTVVVARAEPYATKQRHHIWSATKVVACINAATHTGCGGQSGLAVVIDQATRDDRRAASATVVLVVRRPAASNQPVFSNNRPASRAVT